MQKVTVAIVAVMIFFSVGCSDNPVEPVQSQVSAGRTDQIMLDDPGVEQLSHGKAEDLPLIGYDMSEWHYIGATSEELYAVGTSVAFFSHLGRATGESEFTLTLATGVSHGVTTWTVASGDKVTTSWTSTPTSVTERLIEVTATGGTGRFADASGFSVGQLTILTSDASGGTAEATYKRSITY